MSSLKEPYFTPETIADKAMNMLRSLDEFTRRRSVLFAPERSALLLLDMQVYFFDESSHAFIPSATAILSGVNALVQAFSDRNLPIFLTRHVNTPQDAGQMATWWRYLLSADDPLSLIDPRLKTGYGILIDKTRYDAFQDTPLERLLQDRGVRQLIICGVMTHLCCETTARSAFMRGFEVFFTVDGTATYNESFHRASLLNLAHGFATPILVQNILSALEKRDVG
jgi:bifunctional isochorismate lyase/aryl carrier protein